VSYRFGDLKIENEAQISGFFEEKEDALPIK